jgi:hypothetical protein
MGYTLAVGSCINCGRFFAFNPVKVPSIRVNGEREPICKLCILEANPLREQKGLAPITYEPDAYEACDENELE